MENYQRQEGAAKLKKFYSVMSQALELYKNEEGITSKDIVFDDTSSDYLETWFKSTIGKYITTVKIKKYNGRYIDVLFNDGSGFSGYIYSKRTLHLMYCTAYKYCGPEIFDGRTSFLFTIDDGVLYASIPGYLNENRETLLNLCKYGNSDNSDVSYPKRRHACTALVQKDGWEFKKDYPWKAVIK